ncbi:MAG: hypothetical protein ACK56I_17820, partial [bacterium]
MVRVFSRDIAAAINGADVAAAVKAGDARWLALTDLSPQQTECVQWFASKVRKLVAVSWMMFSFERVGTWLCSCCCLRGPVET